MTCTIGAGDMRVQGPWVGVSPAIAQLQAQYTDADFQAANILTRGFARLGLVAGSGAGSAAATGGLRMQGNGVVQGWLVFRDDTDAADMGGVSAGPGMGYCGAKTVCLGGPYPTRPDYAQLDAALLVSLGTGGNSYLLANAASVLINAVPLLLNNTNFRWGGTIPTPTISQDSNATAGVTGQTLTDHSQDCPGGGASVGGARITRPGSGATGGARITQDGAARDNVTVDDAGTHFNRAQHVRFASHTTADTPVAIAVGDGHYRMLADPNAGPMVYTLPPAASSSGRVLEVKASANCGAVNTVTVDANAAELIDGALTVVLNNPRASVRITCDSVGWGIGP